VGLFSTGSPIKQRARSKIHILEPGVLYEQPVGRNTIKYAEKHLMFPDSTKYQCDISQDRDRGGVHATRPIPAAAAAIEQARQDSIKTKTAADCGSQGGRGHKRPSHTVALSLWCWR